MQTDPFTLIGHAIYWISMLASFVAAAWIVVRRHRYCRRVLGYGLLWAVPVLFAEALFLGFCWMAWEREGFTDLQTAMDRDTILLESLVSIPCKFVGTVIFVVAGMYLAVRSCRASLPLIRGFERRWKTPGGVPIPMSMGQSLGEAVGVALLCLSYTILVFYIARPTESEDIQKMVRAIGEETAQNLLLLKGLIAAPLFEEIVFRHFLQTALAMLFGRSAHARPLAIAVSSLAWSFGHAGMVTPEWAKLAQTLGIGFALGWLYERRGLEMAVLAHFLFNGVSAILMTQFR